MKSIIDNIATSLDVLKTGVIPIVKSIQYGCAKQTDTVNHRGNTRQIALNRVNPNKSVLIANAGYNNNITVGGEIVVINGQTYYGALCISSDGNSIIQTAFSHGSNYTFPDILWQVIEFY